MNIEEQKSKLAIAKALVDKIGAAQSTKTTLQNIDRVISLEVYVGEDRYTILLPTESTEKVQDAIDTLVEELIVYSTADIAAAEAEYTALFASYYPIRYSSNSHCSQCVNFSRLHRFA